MSDPSTPLTREEISRIQELAVQTKPLRTAVREPGEALLSSSEFVFRTAEGGYVWQQPLSIAKPVIEHAYVIPKSEWDTLKERIQALPDVRNWYELAASCCFGTLIGALFALPIFYDIKDRLPIGVWTSTVVVASVTAVLTPILLQFNRKLKTAVANGSVSKIVSDMASIEQRFTKPVDLETVPDLSRSK